MLIAGCYERFLFGYTPSIDKPNEPSGLVRTFNYAAHKGAVKCLAIASGIVASGGADDLIHIYDIQKASDLGSLMNPGEGTVTALDFHVPAGANSPSHLLNGSADGSLTVWQGRSWECLKHMEGHKGEVNDLSIHPSGSVALSVGRDSELRIWNLVKGRITYHSRLACEASAVAFASDGLSYALVCGRDASFHSMEASGVQLADMPHPTKVQTSSFHGPHGFLTGCEDGSLRLWDSRCSKAAIEIHRAHATRVRGITTTSAAHSVEASAGVEDDDEERSQERLLSGDSGSSVIASASTDGVIKLWDLRCLDNHRLLAEASTSARITCLGWMPAVTRSKPHVATQSTKTHKASRNREVAQQADVPAAPNKAIKHKKQTVSPEAQNPSAKVATSFQEAPSATADSSISKPRLEKTLKKKPARSQQKEETASPLQPEQTHSAGRKAKRRKKAEAVAEVDVAQPKIAKAAARKPKLPEQQERPQPNKGVKRKGVVEFKSTADDGPDCPPNAESIAATTEQAIRSKAGNKGGRKAAAAVNLDRFD